MKGIVFSEFLDLVEDKFGADMVDDIIDDSNVPSGGAYTAVGTYDHQEIVDLVVSLSKHTGISVPDLLKVYGQHLFGQLIAGYPIFLEGVDDVFGFLRTLENHIHVEVRKLYPEAELPKFVMEESDGKMSMHYQSERPFADLAEGLLNGCIHHFDQQVAFEREDVTDDGRSTKFTLSDAG